ncbi:AlbA family DNA-binding domain-containing protein [Photobacterium leiognathi]|uniref:AlbA family DNA-binding domain-containing protein n=1 Tax=Photobacterium leiognathi TaxID=553611 RepID=UPI002981B300|nr:ATP-binding protein [Photobacterium leiognathi]
MFDHYQIQSAQKRLKEWEDLFEKYNARHNGWTDTYKEYFVVKNTMYDSSVFLTHLYEQSVNYPQSQHYLNSVRPSLEAGISVYAPPRIQEEIYELARLALQLRLHNKKSDIDSYIKKANNLTYGSLVLRYFREAIDAHKRFADYLLYGDKDVKRIEKAAYIMEGVSSNPGTGFSDLAKSYKLDLDFTKPKCFLVDQFIRGDENHFVEFKAAVVDDPIRERSVDKTALTNKRLEEIVAFLNAGEGYLIVGVEDKNMSVHGIQYEVDSLFRGNFDEYDSYWNKAVRDRIAVAFSHEEEPKAQVVYQDAVYRESIDYNGHRVYMFTCKRKNDRALYYLKTKNKYDFYVRNNNDTQKIARENLEFYLKENGRL